MKRFVALLFSMPLLGACVSQSPLPSSDEGLFAPVGYEALSGWEQEDHASLLPLIFKECRRLANLPPETALGGEPSLPNGTKAGDWVGACTALPKGDAVSPQEARHYFESWFQPYRMKKEAFYTGYYEPQIEASLKRTSDYTVPLYRRPLDLVREKATNGEIVFGRWIGQDFQPYDDRAAIDQGSLKGKGLEIAWLKDPVDLFFLQIQGSGRLLLPDGKVLRVGYSARNGQPYVPIGQVLVRKGLMAKDDVTMESLRNWLAAHPDQVQSILEENPNYVFFKTLPLPPQEGPVGAFGVGLTPGRSVAIDRTYLPFAAPVWVETVFPSETPSPSADVMNWDHLTFAQDVGKDIQGVGRADLFTGWGDQARFVAGNLRHRGHMILLLPRPATTALDWSAFRGSYGQ
ncbi:murein transglycosylase A [Acetobacteraceae bacterium ESL0709]|nr:murein transglycosylase A [Acetobacteraceae bacterium ESL0697]MDF7677809.1 murein transglycosylase A [Acetobacteraceae bacterium ESL0709]